VCYELLLSAINRKRGKHERRVVSALAPLVIDQVTSLRERGVTECIDVGNSLCCTLKQTVVPNMQSKHSTSFHKSVPC